MIQTSAVDEQRFRKLLSRNVSLPLAVGVLSAAFFVILITYLLSAIQWVEHTDRVINNINRSLKLSVDMETGMRGFLLTGDERFLDPYEVAKPSILAELKGLEELVADNPDQVDRFKRLAAMQESWNQFAQEMITLRRNNADYATPIQNRRGKRLTDAIRKEYEGFIAMEQQLRVERSENVSRTIWTSVSLYVLFVFVVSALLALVAVIALGTAFGSF